MRIDWEPYLAPVPVMPTTGAVILAALLWVGVGSDGTEPAAERGHQSYRINVVSGLLILLIAGAATLVVAAIRDGTIVELFGGVSRSSVQEMISDQAADAAMQSSPLPQEAEPEEEEAEPEEEEAEPEEEEAEPEERHRKSSHRRPMSF